MKKKIIGILICMLLITTVLPVAGSMNDRLNQKRNDAALGPDLVYSPTSHDFGYVVTGQTYETTFDIWNGGSGTMTWNLGIVHTWISPNPTSGKSDGYWDKITVTVTIDTTGLSTGDYEGFVSISANDGGGLRYFNIYCKVRPNFPPNTPTITGSTSGKAGTEYEYTIGTTDPNGDKVSYFIDWGDDTYSDWTRYRTSGIKFSSSHIWDERNSYEIKVKAMDTLYAESDWATLTVTMPRNKEKEDSKPFGFILAFGTSVDVQLEPGEDYVDIEILNKKFYIWDQEMITFNPGVFLRLYEAKGLFTPALPFCIGICSDYAMIG